MTVDRHELRNRNTTSTVSSAPSINVSSTLRTEFRTRTPASRTISMRVPAGSVFCKLGDRVSSRASLTAGRRVLARLDDVEPDRLRPVE